MKAELFWHLELVTFTFKTQVTDYLQSIFIVFQDGDFLSITLLVPGLYKILIQLLKSTPEDGFVYLRKQILDIFIFQSKDLG